MGVGNTQPSTLKHTTINYTSYDGNGNLLSKFDARVTVNMGYDPILNRISSKTYFDGHTPSVTYTYDDASVPFSQGCV